jgi:hypothetical protein
VKRKKDEVAAFEGFGGGGWTENKRKKRRNRYGSAKEKPLIFSRKSTSEAFPTETKRRASFLHPED